jgi:hypothetical protein
VDAPVLIAAYMTVLYRMYGIYNVLFGFMGSTIALTASCCRQAGSS